MGGSSEIFTELLKVMNSTLGWDFILVNAALSLLMGLLIFYVMAKLLVDTMEVNFWRATVAWGIAAVSTILISAIAISLSLAWLLDGKLLTGLGMLLAGILAIAVVPCLTFTHFFQCETGTALLLFVTPILPQLLYGQPLAESLTWELTTSVEERERLEDFLTRLEHVTQTNRSGKSDVYLEFLREFNDEPRLRALIEVHDFADLNYHEQLRVEELLIAQADDLRERQKYVFLMTDEERAAFAEEVRHFNHIWAVYQAMFYPGQSDPPDEHAHPPENGDNAALVQSGEG